MSLGFLSERVNARIDKTSKTNKQIDESKFATKNDVDELKRSIGSDVSVNNAIAREQLKMLKRQQSKERTDSLKRGFRWTIKKMAPTPISKKENNELFFGTKDLKNMTGRK